MRTEVEALLECVEWCWEYVKAKYELTDGMTQPLVKYKLTGRAQIKGLGSA